MKRALGIVLLLVVGFTPALAQRRPAPSGPPNPFWNNADAVAAGEQLYNQNCTACHGPNGGAGQIGPAIINTNMSQALRGEVNDYQIVDIIRDGVPGTTMPAWKGKLSNDQILQIGAFLHSLRGMAIDNPLPGDVAKGEAVFWGKGGCGTCHSVSGRGGLIGPDLTDIAGKRKSVQISNALTKPLHAIVGDGGAHLQELPVMDSYDAVHVVLNDGKAIDGVLLNQDSYSLQMIGMDNQVHLLDRADIKTITEKPKLMPTDYDKRLTPAEFKDLMAYLSRLGRKVPASASRGG